MHVFLAGRIVKSGGPELADELERTGYEGIAAELGIDELTVGRPAGDADPFGDPTDRARTLSPIRLLDADSRGFAAPRPALLLSAGNGITFAPSS